MCCTWFAEFEALLAQPCLDTYVRLVYRLRLGQVEAMLDWLDASGKTLVLVA